MKKPCPPDLKETICDVSRGFEMGYKPSTPKSVYLFKNLQGKESSVFKPSNEESVTRQGIEKGEECLREAAVFGLDRGGFSGIPSTTLVEAHHASLKPRQSALPVIQKMMSTGLCSSTKLGLLQLFEEHGGSMDDIGQNEVGDDEAHKIAILDLRVLNADRHGGNILY